MLDVKRFIPVADSMLIYGRNPAYIVKQISFTQNYEKKKMASRAAFISGDSNEDGFTSRLTQVVGKIRLLMVKNWNFGGYWQGLLSALKGHPQFLLAIGPA